jgi:hypothetical protein
VGFFAASYGWIIEPLWSIWFVKDLRVWLLLTMNSKGAWLLITIGVWLGMKLFPRQF